MNDAEIKRLRFEARLLRAAQIDAAHNAPPSWPRCTWCGQRTPVLAAFAGADGPLCPACIAEKKVSDLEPETVQPPVRRRADSDEYEDY